MSATSNTSDPRLFEKSINHIKVVNKNRAKSFMEEAKSQYMSDKEAYAKKGLFKNRRSNMFDRKHAEDALAVEQELRNSMGRKYDRSEFDSDAQYEAYNDELNRLTSSYEDSGDYMSSYEYLTGKKLQDSLKGKNRKLGENYFSKIKGIEFKKGGKFKR